jgi:hypothetical protein
MEVEQLGEDQLLLDLQRARMPGDLGGDVAAAGAEAAAVPLGALLVGALQCAVHRARSAAGRGADTAAPGGGRPRCSSAAAAALPAARAGGPSTSSNSPGDERLVARGGAPDPLLAGALERPAPPLVVAAPDVLARVLRVRSMAWTCERLRSDAAASRPCGSASAAASARGRRSTCRRSRRAPCR